jgi:hypothetical protein
VKAQTGSRLTAAGAGLAIGGAGMAIGDLAAGRPLPRVLEFAWPALVIISVVLTLVASRGRERDRLTIRTQRAVIRQLTEMAHEMFGDPGHE